MPRIVISKQVEHLKTRGYFPISDGKGKLDYSLFSGEVISVLSTISLGAMSDVQHKMTPSAGDVLTWNDQIKQWAPSKITGQVATALNGLSDVDVSGVQDGEVLTYDANTQMWVSSANTGQIPNISMDDLQDVDMTTKVPQSGDILAFDGTSWVAGTVVVPFLGDLDDVAISNPLNGQVLAYNAGTQAWSPATLDIPDVLDDLSDVNAKSSKTGEVLTKLATGQWGPASLPIPALNGLLDVNAPSPTDGQVIAWSAANGKWEAITVAGGNPLALGDLTNVVDRAHTPYAGGNNTLLTTSTYGFSIPGSEQITNWIGITGTSGVDRISYLNVLGVRLDTGRPVILISTQGYFFDTGVKAYSFTGGNHVFSVRDAIPTLQAGDTWSVVVLCDRYQIKAAASDFLLMYQNGAWLPVDPNEGFTAMLNRNIKLGVLEDVKVLQPNDGQVLTYVDASKTWEARSPAATGGSGARYIQVVLESGLLPTHSMTQPLKQYVSIPADLAGKSVTHIEAYTGADVTGGSIRIEVYRAYQGGQSFGNAEIPEGTNTSGKTAVTGPVLTANEQLVISGLPRRTQPDLTFEKGLRVILTIE